MAKVINQKEISLIYQTVPLVRRFSSDHVWFDHDREADVLYISFEKPQLATDSILKDNILIRERNGKIIGLTILNASKFRK